MRLTSVATMDLPTGRLRSYRTIAGAPSRSLPVSFDQQRHVGRGDRAGSWLAAAFRLPDRPTPELLAASWHAVIRRHGTLRTTFSTDGRSRIRLQENTVHPGQWLDHPMPPGADARPVLRSVLDETCRPFAAPSHRLCLLEPDDGSVPVAVVGLDHAHADAWSLMVLARDLDHAVRAGGVLPDLPVPAFAEHTSALEHRGAPPERVSRRWAELIDAGGGAMPRFPGDLGLSGRPAAERVEVRDVLDTAALERLQRFAHDQQGVRLIAAAVAVMSQVHARQFDASLRAVLPVHSRHEERWHDSLGWFITNAVLECGSSDPRAAGAAVAEAVEIGSHPLAPIMERYGGMPERPGMFAVSWLDHRRLPVEVDQRLRAQQVSAVVQTDGVMVWFVANADGLHVRCRYPDTAAARASVGAWLDAVCAGLAAYVPAGFGVGPARTG